MSPVLIFSGLVLGAALVAPFATANGHRGKRYYGRENRSDQARNQEDRAYRVFLGEQRRDFREFRSMTRDDQQHYFSWSHEHPDHVLFQVERR